MFVLPENSSKFHQQKHRKRRIYPVANSIIILVCLLIIGPHKSKRCDAFLSQWTQSPEANAATIRSLRLRIVEPISIVGDNKATALVDKTQFGAASNNSNQQHQRQDESSSKSTMTTTATTTTTNGPSVALLAELSNAENGSNSSTVDTVPLYMQHMTTILIILHLSVFITGLVGNSLVCLSVFRNKSLQTVTNYYIVNLAVADFLVILICLPPTLYWDLTLTWNFGLVLCKLVLYLQSISVSVSVLTLTCISIDRWYAICRPLEFSSTKYRAKITICLIWLISMLIASPDVIFLTTRPLYEENNYVYMDCTYSWPESNTKMYQLCIVTLLFAGPFILMSISYWHIVNVLWRNETMADWNESLQHSFQLEEEQQCSAKRANVVANKPEASMRTTSNTSSSPTRIGRQQQNATRQASASGMGDSKINDKIASEKYLRNSDGLKMRVKVKMEVKVIQETELNPVPLPQLLDGPYYLQAPTEPPTLLSNYNKPLMTSNETSSPALSSTAIVAAPDAAKKFQDTQGEEATRETCLACGQHGDLQAAISTNKQLPIALMQRKLKLAFPVNPSPLCVPFSRQSCKCSSCSKRQNKYFRRHTTCETLNENTRPPASSVGQVSATHSLGHKFKANPFGLIAGPRQAFEGPPSERNIGPIESALACHNCGSSGESMAASTSCQIQVIPAASGGQELAAKCFSGRILFEPVTGIPDGWRRRRCQSSAALLVPTIVEKQKQKQKQKQQKQRQRQLKLQLREHCSKHLLASCRSNGNLQAASDNLASNLSCDLKQLEAAKGLNSGTVGAKKDMDEDEGDEDMDTEGVKGPCSRGDSAVRAFKAAAATTATGPFAKLKGKRQEQGTLSSMSSTELAAPPVAFAVPPILVTAKATSTITGDSCWPTKESSPSLPPPPPPSSSYFSPSRKPIGEVEVCETTDGRSLDANKTSERVAKLNRGPEGRLSESRREQRDESHAKSLLNVSQCRDGFAMATQTAPISHTSQTDPARENLSDSDNTNTAGLSLKQSTTAVQVEAKRARDHSLNCGYGCCFPIPAPHVSSFLAHANAQQAELQPRKPFFGGLKLTGSKTSKRYKKNLANYAARREKYGASSEPSGRSSRLTLVAANSSTSTNCSPLPAVVDQFSSSRFSAANLNRSQQHFAISEGPISGAAVCSSSQMKLEGASKTREPERKSSSNNSNVQDTSQREDVSPKGRASTNGNAATHGYAFMSTNNNQHHSRFCKLIESRKRAAKMLIVIVIMFGLCYLPIHFLNTLRYTIGLPQNDLTTIVSLFSHWLCYFNSAVNPLIYNLMSGKFRHEFANLFFCKCFRRN